MHIDKRAAIAAIMSLVVLSSLSCKGSQPNSNQQSVNPVQGAKPGRWVAQWRSQYSRGVEGTNLAVFSYSSISVVSPQVVCVGGDMPDPKMQDERIGVFIRTTDGGKNWVETLLEMPNLRVTTINSIHFVDAATGWAVGYGIAKGGAEQGVLLKTTDGGSSWSASKVGFNQIPTTVFFADANTGWMGGSSPPPGEEEGDGGPSDLLNTTDGGRTWQSQRRLSTSIADIFFLDKSMGWATGHRGSIYHTADGGRTWNQQRSELEMDERTTDPNSETAKNFIIFGIHSVDAQTGFAAASAEEEDLGRILGTSNGGATWSRKLIAQGEGIRDVFFVSPTEGWAVTQYGNYIYRTTDGGRFWISENIEFPQEVPFFRIGASDPSNVWAAGGGAIFYRLGE